jgi:DnaK suppressor protein
MKELLLAQKQEILKQTLQEVEVDVEGDETDEVQGNMLIEMHNQLSTRNAAKLMQIEAALQRIENKTYGKCEDCGEPIPKKRLTNNPYFQTCIACAEDRETESKKR